jgi:hypothetical protein
MTDAADIASHFEGAKIGFVAQNLSLLTLASRNDLMGLFRRIVGGTDPDIPVIIRRRDDSVYATENMGDLLRKVQSLPGFGLGQDLLKGTPLIASIHLGDELRRAGLLNPAEPLMQFVRHLRNGSAHGNRWFFKNGEPKRLARFRNFELESGLQGGEIFFDYLGQGDWLDLLDDVVEYLRS